MSDHLDALPDNETDWLHYEWRKLNEDYPYPCYDYDDVTEAEWIEYEKGNNK